MKQVLMDNGTVRGALSLLTDPQHASPANSKIFDTSLSCMETLVESLVLSEHISVPRRGGYRPQFRADGYSEVPGRAGVLLGAWRAE